VEQGVANEDGRAYDPMMPAALMLEGIRLWQAPMIAGTAWWNMMVGAWWPQVSDCRRRAPGDERSQLIVPEPIEADGERSLVA
jgi:hypothetical protein